MRKYLIIFSVFLIFLSCGTKQKGFKRIIENGVEVIINYLEPFRGRGEPYDFTLRKEFIIDTEREDLAKIGLTNIKLFDIDIERNIYILSPKSSEKLIYKFNNEGNFITSFAKKGKGPGEFQWPSDLIVNSKKEIVITDRGNNKISFFSESGVLLREIKIPLLGIRGGIPLENGNYIFLHSEVKPTAEKFKYILSLYDSNFNKIKELDRVEYPNPIIGRRLEATYHNLVWRVSDNKIFTGTQDRGYEINVNVYDLEGNLLRKIRKEYKKIAPSEEYKKNYMEMFKSPLFNGIRDKFYFPKSMPPFHSFLTNEKGRLYVMTYERGENPDEYIFDIFNPEGIFIFRKNLRDFSENENLKGKFRNNKFYCIQKKESGFQQFIVYKIKWIK
ncbi:6-bladed beta-propeller [Candidatus Aminicenantes bacterium AH-873-B07]|nr:6-bladed beta-propeller [Candidatus Aminicenantes bacterium AH-873-B07]